MQTLIGFKQALDLTLSNVAAGETQVLPLHCLTGRILAADLTARVDCPSVSSSRKDGYAVVSTDISGAHDRKPVKLKLVGRVAAGDPPGMQIKSGQTVRITTGAPLPQGADAVLSEEFCRCSAGQVLAFNSAEAGRNITRRGRDVRRGETVAVRGWKLTPAKIGLLAAAGLDAAPVYRLPRVTVIATGDEVVLPGTPLAPGKLYASNLVQICTWLAASGLEYKMRLVPDHPQALQEAVSENLSATDLFLTSGGAWGSERDLMLEVLEKMAWQGIYHRVRMGPGKPVAFGLLEQKPFFCLPGGPPSMEMAFLQLALPALLKMQGDQPVLFPLATALLTADVHGKKDWTDFVHARLENRHGQLLVHPARLESALQSMARKEALIIIAEHLEKIRGGQHVEIQLLVSPARIPPESGTPQS